MSLSSHAQTPPAGVEPLRAKYGWIIALGAVYMIAGVIALSSVLLSTAVSVLVVGIMMLVGGIAEIVNAFQVKSWTKFPVLLLLGVLYIAAGFITFENPFLAAAVLTLMLGIMLVASGITRIVLAFSTEERMTWMGFVLSGLITLLLGLVILAHWPTSSLYVLGLFLGIDLIFAGAAWIAVGFGLKGRSGS